MARKIYFHLHLNAYAVAERNARVINIAVEFSKFLHSHDRHPSGVVTLPEGRTRPLLPQNVKIALLPTC